MSTQSDDTARADEIARARNGDRGAFEALVRRYHRRVYATAFRLVGNHSDTDDIVQEAFLRAYRGLSRFDGRADFFTWLYRIVVNVALNHLRSARRRRTTSLDEGRMPPGWDHGGQDPRRTAEARELWSRVAAAIETLGPSLRVTVVLALVEELPHRQVAAIVGCSEGTVAWRVNQARKQLRQKLGAVLPTAEEVGRERAEGDAPGDAGQTGPRRQRVAALIEHAVGLLRGRPAWATLVAEAA